MSNTILDAIKILEEEISNKETALNELKKMIGQEPSKNNSKSTASNNSLKAESSINKPFPVKGRTDAKIKYLFSQVFSKGQRMAEIQDKINEYNGEPLRCDNTVRRMKDSGVLSAIKYNNQNKMTFWGLTDWINFDEKDFKEQYKPSEDVLPLNIKDKEVISMNIKSARIDRL